MEKTLITKSGFKMRRRKINPGPANNDVLYINWLFFPGGPGLGSESIEALVDLLDLPGNLWLVDYTDDGANQINSELEQENIDYNIVWESGMLETVQAVNNPVLVGHSFGGMFIQTIPELEKYIKGLVLLTSAPDLSWAYDVSNRAKEFSIPYYGLGKEEYKKNKNPENYKKFTINCWPLFFLERVKKQGLHELSKCNFSYKTHEWGKHKFHPKFKFNWVAQDLPVYIISGEKDVLTPVSLFEKFSEFKRKNIKFFNIKGSSHFPWLEQQVEIKNIFNDFSKDVITYVKP